MSYDSQRYMEHVFLITPLTDDWYCGVYDNSANPGEDLATCELARTLFSPIAFDSGSGAMANTATIDIGPLPTGTVQGVFLVNGLASNEASYAYPFPAPIDVISGDYLRFNAGDFKVWL